MRFSANNAIQKFKPCAASVVASCDGFVLVHTTKIRIVHGPPRQQFYEPMRNSNLKPSPVHANTEAKPFNEANERRGQAS